MKHLTILFLLAACAAPPPALPPQMQDSCGANEHATLIGQDVTALEKVLILGMVRIIRPNDVVTQDDRPRRINFAIRTDETISAITCG